MCRVRLRSPALEGTGMYAVEESDISAIKNLKEIRFLPVYPRVVSAAPIAALLFPIHPDPQAA